MHILFCNWRDLQNPEGGGSERYIETIASAIVQQGHQVTIACAEHGGAPREETRNGIRYRRRGSKLDVYLRTFTRLLFRRYGKVDVVIDVQNGLPFFTRWATRKPVIVLVHHVHREQWPVVYPGLIGTVGWWIERWLAPRMYRKSPYVTVSQASRAELMELGVDADRIHVVYNGVDRAALTSVARSADPNIVVLGRLVPHKQVEHALNAVAALRGEIANLTIDIVGDGWWRDNLERHAAQLGISDRVTFHGFVSGREKIDALARAWVMALPSLKEGWGIVVLEAAGQGVPTVAYRSAGGTTESIKSGTTGVLAETPEEFTAALQKVLTNLDYRAELGAAATDYAQSFSWDQSAKQFMEIVEEYAGNLREF